MGGSGMIVQTYKVNKARAFWKDEEYDHKYWDLECAHVFHIFELLYEQLNMDENDSVFFFDAPKPDNPQVWKMFSYNSTFYVVAREVTDDELSDDHVVDGNKKVESN
jgi:hypothetical protein